MMNKLFTRSILLFSLVFLFLTTGFISCNGDGRDREVEELNLRLDSLSNALEEQRQRADSLQQLMQQGAMAKDYEIIFGRQYDTIANPREFVKNSLRERKDLIPLEAVVGGTMDYRDIKVLTDDWVLATYDDGHIRGRTIFRYELQPNGKLEFSPLASRRPAPDESDIPYDQQ